MRFHPESPPPDPTQTRQSWVRFTQSGAMDSTVRPHVRSAWERSRAHGCSPYMPRADVLSPADTIGLLKREERLIEVSAPFLGALSRAAGTDRHAAMLADGEGRVLKIVADAITAADEQFPRAGSLLSEAAAGANGIGTPLADGHYVELVGPEHYIEGFHSFTCQGVPLQIAGGAAAGVLSMSVRRIETAHRVRDILFCASEAAECELLSARLAERMRAGGEVDRVAEALRQDIVQRVATTRLQLEIAARRIAAAGDATTALEAARLLVDKFRRQATLWRNLVDDATGSPEPIAVADLVKDFIELMETEARVAEVQVVAYQLDRVFAHDDQRALTRRLLSRMLDALHRAEKHSAIRVTLAAAADVARIVISGKAAEERPFDLVVDSPILA